jgi:predicted DNA-binding WGR domain protein
MRRFEFGSSKFWEVETKGKDLLIRFGKLGANGQLKLKTLGSPAAAIAEMEKVIGEKTRKGYAEVSGKTPVVAAKKSSSGIKPTQLKIAKLSTSGSAELHRVVLLDDDVGHVALATGGASFVTSDGKKAHKRGYPGTSYGIIAHDGLVVSMGTDMMSTRDFGATWKKLKAPYQGYTFAMMRDSAGTFWLGCDGGEIFTSKKPDGGWTKAKFKAPGKVMAFTEIDGNLYIAAEGSGVWNGKKFTKLSNVSKSTPMTRVTRGPNGGFILIGDSGTAFKSPDGKKWTAVKTGVKDDLEDCAWVAGSLFVVGGSNWGSDGVVLRSDDEGKSYKKVPFKDGKLWSIESWGDGAVMAGEHGLFTLMAPTDPYWKGAKDRYVPEPPKVDVQFTPLAARSDKDLESKWKKLHAAALADHERISAKQRSTRAADENAKLAAAVDEGSEGAEAIYADYLQDAGDPRGELAQIQLRLAKDPKNKELKKTEKALLKQHGDTWLGKLADVPDMIKLEWTAGFISKARLSSSYERDGDFGSNNDDEGKKPLAKVKLVNVLEWLLGSPSGRFLRELVVGIVEFDGNNYNGIIKELAKHYLPSLRSLYLGDFHGEETELNWSEIGQMEPAYAALPNLESLKLRSGSMKLGAIVLPNLKKVEIVTGGLRKKEVQSVVAAVWPSLETLSLQIGPGDSDSDVKTKDITPLFDGETLPRLKHLGIDNYNHTGELVEPLATSKILPQLTRLDLRMGTLADEHVTQLFRLQKAFAHLEKLDLDDNYLGKESKKLFAQAKLPVNFGEQREDEGDPDDRYASAYE